VRQSECGVGGRGEIPHDAPAPAAMLEHPIYVHWCGSCGLEVAEEERRQRRCPRCSGRIVRYQRVLELPDAPTGALSLQSLRAALAEVSAGERENPNATAVLFSEPGPDPQVAYMHPALAAQLTDLHVPPTVQRALVARGFDSFERICAAMASTTEAGGLAEQLGLPEVLLRRLWSAVDARYRSGHEQKRAAAVLASPQEDGVAAKQVLRNVEGDAAAPDELLLLRTAEAAADAADGDGSRSGFLACDGAKRPRPTFGGGMLAQNELPVLAGCLSGPADEAVTMMACEPPVVQPEEPM